MAYKQISPQVVAEGGTGVGSTTVYAVLCGGTTSTGAIQSIASVGTAAQVLTSNGAALPTFQAAAAASITGPGSSTDNALARWNGVGGDTLQDSTVIVNDDGQMTNASQPAFLGYLITTASNVTGDDTAAFLGDSDISLGLTEVFDQSDDFTPSASGGATFEAPVAGTYCSYGGVIYGGITSGMNTVRCTLKTTNINWVVNNMRSNTTDGPNNEVGIQSSVWTFLDVADTVKCEARLGGGSKVVDVLGTTGGDYRVYFSGFLHS